MLLQCSTENGLEATATSSFRLGMPHLNSRGLSASWLMKEVGHLHWLAVAEELDTAPSQWVDDRGRRCFASVVTATLSGSLTDYVEDTLCQFRMVVRPCAETSWLSQIDLECVDGNRICVELMTVFASLESHSNTSLVRSDIASLPSTTDYDPNKTRAQNLRNLFHQERKRAHDPEKPPHVSYRIATNDHLNGVGLVYFARFQNFFGNAEENAIPEMPKGTSLVARRVHYYGNMDAGDTLDIVTDVTTNVKNLPAWLMTYSSARRRSDSALIAACESSYRVVPSLGA